MKAAISRWLSISGILSWALLANAVLAEPALGQDVVQSTATLSLLPGGILPDSPLAQVIKLVQAGVDVAVIQNFITNSTSTFNLDADKIISLKDVGAPNNLATLMIQHDRVLQDQIAAATPPAATPPVAPVSAPAPLPGNTLLEGSPVTDAPAAPSVTINYFYDLLSPYGSWVEIEDFGRCWQPGVAVYQPDWQPYADHGHWVYTDSGWYWVSDYSWGWVPFHYGRWLHDPKFGWCWCPDTVWGPSWVTWRCSDDYFGWAPLPPGSEYVDGSGFVYDGSIVSPDFDFGLAPDYFIFVMAQDFCDPHPSLHRIDRGRISTVYHQTTALNQFDRDDRLGFINHGIDPRRVSRATHVAIQPLAIHETSGVVGLFGHGEAVQGSAVVVNRPQFLDPRDNLAVAWNRNPPAAANSQAPENKPEPEHSPSNSQWQNQEPTSTTSPEPEPRTVGNGGYLVPAPPRYESNYQTPARQEGPRESGPKSEVQRGPDQLKPPVTREEPKPAGEPAHNSPAPAPAEAKSNKTSDTKSGSH